MLPDTVADSNTVAWLADPQPERQGHGRRGGKGDKRRVVGLDPGAMAVLERWIEKRAQLEKVTRRSPLFCTLQGGPLSAQYVGALIPRLASRAGIEKRCNPHTFRHTHAAELARERLPMDLVQAQLGHSSLATTSRYLQHIAPTELVDAIQAREWCCSRRTA
ncbi:MAG: tyrosine-type recombinase/integrase [Gaiellaceae bacterium]